MTAYRAVVISDAREWVCKHRHRTELAAFDCALREIRHRVTRLLRGDPCRPDARRYLGQWLASTRESGDA